MGRSDVVLAETRAGNRHTGPVAGACQAAGAGPKVDAVDGAAAVDAAVAGRCACLAGQAVALEPPLTGGPGGRRLRGLVPQPMEWHTTVDVSPVSPPTVFLSSRPDQSSGKH